MRAYRRYLLRVLREKFAGRGRIDFAEVGAKKAHTTLDLLNELPALRATLVDPWLRYNPSHPAHAEFGDRIIDQSVWNCHHADAVRNMAPFGDRVRILRMTTEEAVGTGKLKPASFDFVFVDSDHWSCGVDMACLWPTLRLGGAMVGHDYTHQRNNPDHGRWDVKEAADNFAKFYGQQNLGEFGCWRFDRTAASPAAIDRILSGPLAGQPLTWPLPKLAKWWQKRPAGGAS